MVFLWFNLARRHRRWRCGGLAKAGSARNINL
jgi:hypothetical protein